MIDLLRTIESKHQIRRYIERFGSIEKRQFAVVAVGSDIVSNDGELHVLADSLAFLQHVGLSPIVVHGEISVKGRQGHCTSDKLETIVSDPDDHNIFSRMRAANMRLIGALDDLDVHVRPVNAGVFSARPFNVPRSNGSYSTIEGNPMGVPTDISTKLINSAVSSNCLPVLPAVGVSAHGQVLALETNRAAACLSQVLKPLKTVFLSSEAGDVDVIANDTRRIFHPSKVDRFRTSQTMQVGTRRQLHLLSLQAKATGSITSMQETFEKLRYSSSIFFGQASSLPYALLSGSGGNNIGYCSQDTRRVSLTMIRKVKSVNVVTSAWMFKDPGSIKSVLHRHWQEAGASNPLAEVEEFMLQLRNRKFVGYFDDSPTENLAIVFPHSCYSWKSQRNDGRCGFSITMPELSIFAISKLGWVDETAEQVWERIHHDHPQIWGTVKDEDTNMEWWFERARGSARRAADKEIDFWCGKAESFYSHLQSGSETVGHSGMSLLTAAAG